MVASPTITVSGSSTFREMGPYWPEVAEQEPWRRAAYAFASMVTGSCSVSVHIGRLDTSRGSRVHRWQAR